MISARLARVLAICWTLLILAGLSIPGSELPDVSVLRFDKLVHFGIFFVLGLLWMHALPAPPARRALWVVLAGALYAVATELIQGMLPFDRQPDPLDVVADVAGLVVAVVVYRMLTPSELVQRT
jgi:VanZ family protein